MHEMFYKHINPEATGRYRTEPVIITGSQYEVCKVEQIEGEMKNCSTGQLPSGINITLWSLPHSFISGLYSSIRLLIVTAELPGC